MAPAAVAQAKAEAPGGHSSTIDGWREMSESQKQSHFIRACHCRYLQRETNPTKRKHAAMKSVLRSCGEGAADRKRYKVAEAMSEDSSSDSSDDEYAANLVAARFNTITIDK